MSTAESVSELAFPPAIERLHNLSHFKIWLLTISVSVVMTEIIVSVMELLLKRQVTYDYLLTGLVASFFVAGIIGDILISLLTRLNMQVQHNQWMKHDLEDSEERYKLAIMASNSAMWDYELASGRVYLSENWSKFLCGDPKPTYTTIHELTELVPKEERQAVRDAILQVIKDQAISTYNVSHHVKRPDGEYILISSVGQVTKRDEDGRALHMIGINREIYESE